MFKQAKRIEGNKVTFKSIFESGIEKRLWLLVEVKKK
jgi:hypothetical protein